MPLAALLLLGLLRSDVPCAAEPQYVRSRDVLVTFTTDHEMQVTDVELWVSRDGGQAWTRAAARRASPRAVGYSAPEDGRYEFYLVLHNDAGASAPPPDAYSTPHLRVIVDTQPPVLQLHAPAPTTPATAGTTLAVRLSLIDEHLGECGVRVFYRPLAESAWRDGGQRPVCGQELAWPIPAGLAGTIALRCVATDRAGNQAQDDLEPIQIVAQPTGAP